MNSKIEETIQKENLEFITGTCPNCNNESKFSYEGFQKAYKDRGFELYSCSNCNSTIRKENILKLSSSKDSFPE